MRGVAVSNIQRYAPSARRTRYSARYSRPAPLAGEIFGILHLEVFRMHNLHPAIACEFFELPARKVQCVSVDEVDLLVWPGRPDNNRRIIRHAAEPLFAFAQRLLCTQPFGKFQPQSFVRSIQMCRPLRDHFLQARPQPAQFEMSANAC